MKAKQGSLSTQEIKRLQGINLIHKGDVNESIADIVDAATRTVRRWRRKLKDSSEKNTLHRKKGSGRIAKLTDDQKQQLKQIILQGAVKAGYSTERWTSKIIAHLIQITFNVTLAPRTVRD